MVNTLKNTVSGLLEMTYMLEIKFNQYLFYKFVILDSVSSGMEQNKVFKSNCVQEFLIPSFWLREHCHADEATIWTSSCWRYQRSHLGAWPLNLCWSLKTESVNSSRISCKPLPYLPLVNIICGVYQNFICHP